MKQFDAITDTKRNWAFPIGLPDQLELDFGLWRKWRKQMKRLKKERETEGESLVSGSDAQSVWGIDMIKIAIRK